MAKKRKRVTKEPSQWSQLPPSETQLKRMKELDLPISPNLTRQEAGEIIYKRIGKDRFDETNGASRMLHLTRPSYYYDEPDTHDHDYEERILTENGH